MLSSVKVRFILDTHLIFLVCCEHFSEKQWLATKSITSCSGQHKSFICRFSRFSPFLSHCKDSGYKFRFRLCKIYRWDYVQDQMAIIWPWFCKLLFLRRVGFHSQLMHLFSLFKRGKILWLCWIKRLVWWWFVTKLAVFSSDFVGASRLPRNKIFRLFMMIHSSSLAHWTCWCQTQFSLWERRKKLHQIPNRCQCFWTGFSSFFFFLAELSNLKSSPDLRRHSSFPESEWPTELICEG